MMGGRNQGVDSSSLDNTNAGKWEVIICPWFHSGKSTSKPRRSTAFVTAIVCSRLSRITGGDSPPFSISIMAKIIAGAVHIFY